MKIYSALYHDDAHLLSLGYPFKCIRDSSQYDSDEGILILHGGEDISPALYGQEPGGYTYAKSIPSTRDKTERDLIQGAIARGFGLFGICRGAQLLTAIAGGSLIQDVSGHLSEHLIDTTDGERLPVTSAHHQMCNPSGTDHQLLAWSHENRSRYYRGEHDKEVDMPIEPEVIFYPRIKALACQPHPEWMPETSDFVQYLLKQIKEKLI